MSRTTNALPSQPKKYNVKHDNTRKHGATNSKTRSKSHVSESACLNVLTKQGHTKTERNGRSSKRLNKLRKKVKNEKAYRDEKRQKQKAQAIKRAKSYIRNISNVTLTDSEILVLSKNLKFAPTPDPPTTREIIKDFDDMAKRMRTRLWAYENKRAYKKELFTSNERKSMDTPSNNIALENYLTATKIELANMHTKRRFDERTRAKQASHNIQNNKAFKRLVQGNFSSNLKKALFRLQRNKQIIIKKSDKGNCTVVVNRDQYIKEGMRQLHSCAHYTEIENDISDNICKLVHDTLSDMHSKGEISKRQLKYLSPQQSGTIKTAELYLLNKIHSDPPTKGRPIISANDCPVERISDFVDFFLQPFVLEQNTYIKDTSDFIRKIEQLQVPKNALIITLDYESMYTNIVHEEAVESVRKTIIRENRHCTVKGMKRPSVESFCKLIELAVKCNNFKFNGRNFYQCRGVAMGHKASPSISDIVIYYLEENILALAEGRIYKWLRFRDDVFAIYTGNEGEAAKFLDTANEIHPTLKFKYNISNEQGIFLDTVVFKGKRFKKANILDFKPYVKPSENFQYIHRQSSHPKSVFRGLIKGELIRFVRTATNIEDYLDRAQLFKQKLLLRGYSLKEFNTAFMQVNHAYRSDYLAEKQNKLNKQTPLVFTTKYSPHLSGFRKALTHNWDLIEKSNYLEKIFPRKPIIAFRRNKNLRDSLVRARLKPTSNEEDESESNQLDRLISLLLNDPDTSLKK